jgi:cation diffusion facilitator family transporter
MNNHNHQYIVREGWVSILTNLLLFALKYWAGLASGSIALIADAWHTLTDSVSSVIVLIGGKLSNKPADEEHPFGHGRAEHIAAIIIGVLLAIVAFDFILNSVEKFNSREAGNFGTIAIVVTIISIVGKEALAQYAFLGYRQTKSAVLKADAWHHRTDSLSSVIILVGILVGKYYWWIDSLMALIVALMIAYASFEILSKEIKSLLGERIDPELIQAIKVDIDGLLEREVYIHHFHLHQYGQHNELSCHIKLPANMSLNEAHAICTRIESRIKEKFGLITTIHPEPLEE